MRGLRRRRSGDASKAEPVAVDPRDAGESRESKALTSPTFGFFRFCCILPTMISCVSLCLGIYLNHKYLYTHDECDMTWSHRAFIPIPLPPPSTRKADHYGLFKFVDRRDHRNKLLLEKNFVSDLSSPASWCYAGPNNASTTTAVLYVPGHGGSYEQARSLGAHGIQMTRRMMPRQDISHSQAALQSMEWTGTVSDLNKFVYDVFSVDFGEEPTGLHGAFVHSQAAFLAHITHTLIESCRFDQVAVVAHSMGGYAVELARILDPTIQAHIRNMVSLGTPHAHPSLAWEYHLYEVWERIQRESRDYDFAVVSVSGGLGDALIPLVSCDASRVHTASKTIMATEIMDVPVDNQDKRPPTLGMDHQAIVWCHNLLANVRGVLHHLIVGQKHLSSMERVANIGNIFENISPTYEDAVKKQYQELRAMFGPQAIFMEASLTHKSLWLVSFYCLIAACHCTLPALAFQSNQQTCFIRWLIIPVLSALLCYRNADSNGLSAASSMFLSFTANGAFQTTFFLINRFAVGSLASVRPEVVKLVAVSMIPLTILVVPATVQSITMIWSLSFHGGFLEYMCLSAILLIYLLDWIHLGILPGSFRPCLSECSKSPGKFLPDWRHPRFQQVAMLGRRIIVSAWLLPVLPVLLAGDVAVILRHGQAMPHIFSTLVVPILCWLLLGLALLELPLSFGKGRVGMLTTLLRLVTVITTADRYFRLELPEYGAGFASTIVNLVSSMLQLEILEMLVVWMLGRSRPVAEPGQ